MKNVTDPYEATIQQLAYATFVFWDSFFTNFTLCGPLVVISLWDIGDIKGRVSRDFGGLQMILINKLCVQNLVRLSL